MNSRNDVWLRIEEICALTGDKKETVRRKCKSGKYKSKVQKNGKYKIYFIPLTALSEELQQKYYFNKKTAENKVSVETIENNSEVYSNAPAWAKKQADKYLELINATNGLTYSQIKVFLQIWNQKFPDKSCGYTSLFRAKKEYEKYGINLLLLIRLRTQSFRLCLLFLLSV